MLTMMSGALGGLVLGWIFPETLHRMAGFLWDGAAPWQLGVVWGFFRSLIVGDTIAGAIERLSDRGSA